MRLPFTHKLLQNWGGPQVLSDAEVLVERGLVLDAVYEPPLVSGTVLWNNRPVKTALKLSEDGTVESLCPCYTNKERGLICSHVIALGLVLVRRASDPRREQKYQEELRRASRLQAVDQKEYLRRVPPDTPGALPAKLILTLPSDWKEAWLRDSSVNIACEAEFRGARQRLDQVPADLPLVFDKADESLLFVLEDIAEGPVRGEVTLNPYDLVNVIRLHAGRAMPCADGTAVRILETKLATHLRMDLDRENGEILLFAHTELPFHKPGEFPIYIVGGNSGWVHGDGNLWPLENLLPTPYHGLYREPVAVGRTDVIRFLERELPGIAKHITVESDLSIDLFTIEPATPKILLLVRGSPASLAAELHCLYNGTDLIAAKISPQGHFAIADPNDLMRYTVRNMDTEKEALGLLAPSGFRGECGDNLSTIVGNREVLNFFGSHLPSLRRRGWEIKVEGRASPFFEQLEFITPVVRIAEPPDTGWFDVGFDFEDAGRQSVSHSDIQTAILKGDSFIERNGRTLLIDTEAVESLRDVFSDCITRESNLPGRFRMADTFAPFVKSSLDALDGVDVEDPPAWRVRADRGNRTLRIEPVKLDERLEQILRPYQKDGVDWLRFLETHGFCGLLADEMGLGKTLQALAWLAMERQDPDARGKPALIVCPTSLVENWVEEAGRFVPKMRTLILSGPDRDVKWEQVANTDLAILSYAILRRDVERCLQYEFSAVILDEAQHIKNRSTQNAVAAKRLRAKQRLVLTGTPVENSVSDLWSIMDFLMPGYLGSHEKFRGSYELPVSRAGQEGLSAQTRLRRKLHPFILRRRKAEVATELPPKIRKVASCSLTRDQKAVYTELLDSSRRRISAMVAKNGFNKCRMEILTLLLRLRQACCHLDLLKLPDLKPEYPSGKMDLFFELLDEAMDSGHRVLVFSQFVSMLDILKAEFDRRGIDYCYLVGATKERMQEVRRFNSQRDIPVFLISLKAGGTGLNLTGADMVIHFDPWWNPAVEDQATDRAYRIGQKRTVYSIKLITKGTIEEKVLALQEKKQSVISALVESDERMMETMTWDDVQELLSL